jgi:phytoene dehydrogenase-like protein
VNTSRSVTIIGAGIAGLSAGIYAQLCGYNSRIYEMHTMPGGLMTAWKRQGYTFDGCIHWLTGSSPRSSYYSLWEQIGLIQGRTIYDPEVFMRYEGRQGQVLNFYSDIHRLEQHLLELAPEDRPLIQELCAAARSMVGFNPPISAPGGFVSNLFSSLRVLPKLITTLPSLRRWGGMSLSELASRFTNPFLREVFADVWFPEMSAAALVFTLAFVHGQDAGYPIGGSLPMALAVEKRYHDLGGETHYRSRVEKILVESAPDGTGSRACGVRLADGREERADYVISAADGHATIFELLEGRFVDDKLRGIYAEYPLFPPIMFIGLGIDRTFPDLPCATGGINLCLSEPIQVADQPVEHLELMVYNFDPTLAPEGKTAITAMLRTVYPYWKALAADRERYEAEKERIAQEVIARLDQRFPGLAGQVEVIDVATPITFERYTGNWQASFEGFLPTPRTMMAAIPKTLPGLSNLYMAGQWVQAGGGLPTGVLTGREVLIQMCKKDGVKFVDGHP